MFLWFCHSNVPSIFSWKYQQEMVRLPPCIYTALFLGTIMGVATPFPRESPAYYVYKSFCYEGKFFLTTYHVTLPPFVVVFPGPLLPSIFLFPLSSFPRDVTEQPTKNVKVKNAFMYKIQNEYVCKANNKIMFQNKECFFFQR